MKTIASIGKKTMKDGAICMKSGHNLKESNKKVTIGKNYTLSLTATNQRQ